MVKSSPHPRGTVHGRESCTAQAAMHLTIFSSHATQSRCTTLSDSPFFRLLMCPDFASLREETGNGLRNSSRHFRAVNKRSTISAFIPSFRTTTLSEEFDKSIHECGHVDSPRSSLHDRSPSLVALFSSTSRDVALAFFSKATALLYAACRI